MTTIENVIEDAVRTGFALAGYDESLGRVTVSNRPDLCDYQSSGALAGAKKYHKKPMEIASDVAAKLTEMQLDGLKLFSMADPCMPGFLNLKLNPEYTAKYLNEMSFRSDLGLTKDFGGKKIIVDYGGANVAKPLHVGHLRSAVIGECIKRLSIRMGNETIGDVHLGDWGLQMGLIIAELQDRGKLGEDFTISELEEIYPAASKKAKEKDDAGNLVNPEFAERAHEATRKLQEGDPVCHKVWEQIMKVSTADLKKNYDALDVHFDLWKGESDAEPYIPGLIQNLVDQGLAYESDGALVVDISEPDDPKELPPCMIRKSDGASLYATSDLGTIVEREKLYHPDRYIYIADSRQSLHYTQFFRVARKAGLVKPATDLTFIGFGTVNGKDGKPFKTRDGGVLRLETLIRDTDEKVLERIHQSRDDMTEAEAAENAKIIGLSALKYGDLSNQASKDYVFDLDKFTSFEGNTGPYLLYTIVRIGSVLRKYAESEEMAFSSTADFVREHAVEYQILPVSEKNGENLEMLLCRYQDVLIESWKELAPHKICSFVYALANSFNSFYHNVMFLTETDEAKKKGYLGLLMLTFKVLEDCIGILGFSAPDKM